MKYNNEYLVVNTNLKSVIDVLDNYGILETDTVLIENKLVSGIEIFLTRSSDYIKISGVYTSCGNNILLYKMNEYITINTEEQDRYRSFYMYEDCTTGIKYDVNLIEEALADSFKSLKDVKCTLHIKAHHESLDELAEEDLESYLFYKGIELNAMEDSEMSLFDYLVSLFADERFNYEERYDYCFGWFVGEYMENTFGACNNTIHEGFLANDEFTENFVLGFDIDYENERIDFTIKTKEL